METRRTLWSLGLIVSLVGVACSSDSSLLPNTLDSNNQASSPTEALAVHVDLSLPQQLSPQTLQAFQAGSFQPSVAPLPAKIIGVGDASPWAVDLGGNIFHYSTDVQGPRTWFSELTTADTTSLAVSPEGTVWRVTATGALQASLTGTTWTSKSTPPGGVWEIGVGRFGGFDDVVWAVAPRTCTGTSNTNCDIWLYWT